MSDIAAGSVETQKDIGTDPAAVVRRWLLELTLAGKEEKKWRENVEKLFKKYRAQNQSKNSFNIFWANTEVMRQAVYSAQPTPDIRRRFKDADPLGKAVAETLNRSITFSLDCGDFDATIKQDVLDNLIAGRGISRIRYIPSLVQSETAGAVEKKDDVALEGEQSEELAWEQVTTEHVQWDDFRHGPGKTWPEVGWIAFRHYLKRDELEKRFGEKGKKLPLNSSDDKDIASTENRDPDTAELFKTAEVWEIWDRDQRKVIFVSEGNKDETLLEVEDPLKLEAFYPNPRPLYALEDTETLVPTPIYDLYKEQADELNRISGRINKIVDALKVRGIYDSTLGELSELYRSGDNDLIPASSVTALAERGGLDKFIWFAPIEQAAIVLKELYLQREQCKQTIYELTGISDVIRGSTDPNETATAQGLKSKWGSLRLQRMQQDVQRYIRDIIRLMAEVIAGKFQQDTLQKMTMLPYPTEQQAQLQAAQVQQQYQVVAQQAAAQGKQPPPPPQIPKPITWEQIVAVLRDDAQRSYKIDIETDSTIAVELQTDMQGLQEILSALGQTMPGLMEAVQAGFLPFEAAKEIMLTICRRAKLGNAVEDAIDKMQPPQPRPDPEAGKAQALLQVEQMKGQLADQQHQRELAADAQYAKLNAQIELQKEQAKQAFQHQQVEAQNQLEAQRMQLEQANEARIEQMRIASDERIARMENQMQLLITQLNNQNKIEVAELSASTTLQSAQISAARAAETVEE